MILAKAQNKPATLVTMEALACRMILARIDMEYLNNLRRGFQGEVNFVQRLAALGDEVLVFPDLLLQPRKGNAFQLDVVVLIGRVFYIYEVKNFSGEWRYSDALWVNHFGTKAVNPLHRMEENLNKFKKVLDELGYGNEFQVEAHTVLVDPGCTLYFAPDNQPLILPTQLKSHIEKLGKHAPPLTSFHRKVMEDLLAMQGKPKVFWEDVPAYEWDTLQKSVYCHECKSPDLIHTRYSYRCKNCNHKDDVLSLIESSILDFQALFPLEKVKGKTIEEWIGGKYSRKSILRVINRMNNTTERDALSAKRLQLKT